MKVELKEIEKNKVLLEVEFPAEQLESAVEKAYQTIAEKLEVPGFRKGKVPKAVIDSRFDKQSILNEAFANGLPSYYSQAVEKLGIKPIDQPKIDIIQLEEGKAVKFNATVDVQPEVKLGKYKKVKVEKSQVKVSKKEVDEQTKLLQEKFAQLEVAGGGVIKKGDFALINYDGSCEGKPFEGGSASDYLLEIGSNLFPPGFEEQLIGARKGEIRDICVDMPKNHQTKDIAGKKVKFRVLVKEVKLKKLPPLNNDFAKQVGEYENLKDLQSDIKKNIKNVKEEQAKIKVRGDLLNKVSQASEVEIPEVMVKRRVDTMIKNLSSDLEARKLNLDDYLKAMKTSRGDLEAQLRKEAGEAIRSRMVLETIIEKEGLEVNQNEVDNEIEELAKNAKVDSKEVKNSLNKEGKLELIRESILLRKSLDLLADEAEISTEEDKG